MADDTEGTRAADESQGGQTFLGEHKTGGSGKPKVGTAVIELSSGRRVGIQFVDVDGIAVVEGDIALGPVEAVQRRTEVLRDEALHGVARAVAITGAQFRWTNCTVPYEIDPSLPNQQRVTDAIAHWQSRTGLQFVVRSTEANWVFFTDAGGCWSMVGMRGGRQTISLGTGCSTGNAIHEIGHAVGLWHEQSREDRDTFVTINWANIQPGMESQFSQHIADGDDVGAYDYGSIMHYPRTAFSRNGLETITPVDASAQIGQRNGLSDADIAAIAALYPACHVKRPLSDVTVPIKKIRDDGVKPISDRPIKKISDDRVKKVRDDNLFKKIRDDGVIKPIGDIGPGGPVKRDVNPGPLTSVTTAITGGMVVQPFALATPHHAALSPEEAAFAQAADLTQQLQEQLLEAEAAVGRARAAVAEATIALTQSEAAKSHLETAYAEVVAGLDLGLG